MAADAARVAVTLAAALAGLFAQIYYMLQPGAGHATTSWRFAVEQSCIVVVCVGSDLAIIAIFFVVWHERCARRGLPAPPARDEKEAVALIPV